MKIDATFLRFNLKGGCLNITILKDKEELQDRIFDETYLANAKITLSAASTSVILSGIELEYIPGRKFGQTLSSSKAYITDEELKGIDLYLSPLPEQKSEWWSKKVKYYDVSGWFVFYKKLDPSTAKTTEVLASNYTIRNFENRIIHEQK